MRTRQADGYLSLESWLTGGASIVISLGFWMFVDPSASLNTISSVAFTLAFVCNHPHFLSSYVLLYGEYGDRVWRRPRYIWVGVIVPVALALALGLALARAEAAWLAHMITLMYFLVGWHYVKQIFGCVIVTSVRRKVYLSRGERRVLLVNLFLAWFMSWLHGHVGVGNFDFYGIQHKSLELPRLALDLTYAGVGASLLMVLFTQVRRYVRTGETPAPPAVVAFVSLYVWYLPAAAHPAFAYLIPFFHSLQYLVFVGRLKSNQVRAEVQNLEGPDRRLATLKALGGFALAATALGALAFQSLPAWLDQRGIAAAPGLGFAPMMAAFILFINIHHYFIDNVIWRADNETARAYLFGAT